MDFLGQIREHWGHYGSHRVEDLVVTSDTMIFSLKSAHSGKGSHSRSSLDTLNIISIEAVLRDVKVERRQSDVCEIAQRIDDY